jgi:molybdate transport system substrate-binding protein
MAGEVRLLSGGAAKGLVSQLQDRFSAQTGFAIHGDFGAVGVMRDRLLAGEPCDVVILSQALIDQLARDGHVAPESVTPLGAVKTGVAVKTGQRAPEVGTAAALKSALLAASAIYFPDPQKATAGIHFMKVLKSLGVDEQLAPRLRPYPNGATAMREMAQCSESGLIGCTQVTEINYTTGVQLIGLLPQEYELATVYTAAVCTRATQPTAAANLIRLLASREAAGVRASGGFEAA